MSDNPFLQISKLFLPPDSDGALPKILRDRPISNGCRWEFDKKNCWIFTNGLHSQGWVTAMVAEDGSRIQTFEAWLTPEIRCGDFKTLDLAQKAVRRREVA